MERGEIYNIDNNIIFNMGGAFSIDRNNRIKDKSWWEAEVPTREEFENGLKNLELSEWKVDYIFGHTTSNYVIDSMFQPKWKINDITAKYFDHIVDTVDFKKFYFGHWHEDINSEKYCALYHTIIQLGD